MNGPRFIARVRKWVRSRNLELRFVASEGAGSHGTLYAGDRKTIVKGLGENASQAVFARYLNVTAGLVSQWERGEKRPRGASLKLLTLVAKNGLGAVA